MMDADRTALVWESKAREGQLWEGDSWEGEAPAEPSVEDRTQMVTQPAAEATQFAAQVECPVCKTPNPPSETWCIDCGFLLASAPVATAGIPEPPSFGALVTTDGTREFALKSGENTVGRENADVLLSDNTVSRKHAKITVADGRVLVQDVGSANGTRVNGRHLAQGDVVEIRDGADLEFGRALLKYKAPAREGEAPAEPSEATEAAAEGGETPSPLAGEGWGEGEEPGSPSQADTSGSHIPGAGSGITAPEPSAAIPVARLISKDGALTFDLSDGTAKIGRRQGDNDVVIPDPYCSGRHAELTVGDGAFTITDVGSTNGTLVNGVKLEPNVPRQVQPGDEITFGQMAFTIEATT